jgi:hypothetical protein
LDLRGRVFRGRDLRVLDVRSMAFGDAYFRSVELSAENQVRF